MKQLVIPPHLSVLVRVENEHPMHFPADENVVRSVFNKVLVFDVGLTAQFAGKRCPTQRSIDRIVTPQRTGSLLIIRACSSRMGHYKRIKTDCTIEYEYFQQSSCFRFLE